MYIIYIYYDLYVLYMFIYILNNYSSPGAACPPAVMAEWRKAHEGKKGCWAIPWLIFAVLKL